MRVGMAVGTAVDGMAVVGEKDGRKDGAMV